MEAMLQSSLAAEKKGVRRLFCFFGHRFAFACFVYWLIWGSAFLFFSWVLFLLVFACFWVLWLFLAANPPCASYKIWSSLKRGRMIFVFAPDTLLPRCFGLLVVGLEALVLVEGDWETIPNLQPMKALSGLKGVYHSTMPPLKDPKKGTAIWVCALRLVLGGQKGSKIHGLVYLENPAPEKIRKRQDL